MNLAPGKSMFASSFFRKKEEDLANIDFRGAKLRGRADIIK
jgi:hypothetical protein